MARPIKETPILFGEDALRFEQRMKEVRKETQEQKEQRLKDYEMFIQGYNRGFEERKAGKALAGIIKAGSTTWNNHNRQN